MAQPQERLNCSKVDGGEVRYTGKAVGRKLQQENSMTGANQDPVAAVPGMPACQRDRYKKVTQDRRCFGSGFHPQFGGENQSRARI
jgi:hypothetical protein